MSLSPAVLALTTLSFAAALALLIQARKAHNVLQNNTSAAFLSSISLLTTGLFVRFILDTQTDIGRLTTTLIQGLLGLSSAEKLLLILSSLLILSAYLLLLFVAERIYNTSMRILAVLVVLLTTFISIEFYVAFHLITAIILSLLAYRFYTNYLTKNSTNALIVYIAFLLLLIAHTAAVFMPFSTIAHYVFLGGRLAGYFALFVMLWRVRQ